MGIRLSAIASAHEEFKRQKGRQRRKRPNASSLPCTPCINGKTIRSEEGIAVLMNYEEISARLKACGVIPVVAIDKPELAIPLADALLEGGLPVAEITFRTPAAADVIDRIHSERPEILLGAGTVLTPDNLVLAKKSGASFGVAPGLNTQIATEARQMEFPFIPGVMTPSEIEKALSLGYRVLKFFPAEACGGLKTLKALAAPYLHVGVKFVPTGGVNLENMGEYLKFKAVLSLGGTWIALPKSISEGNWKQIRDNCHTATSLIRHLRSESNK